MTPHWLRLKTDFRQGDIDADLLTLNDTVPLPVTFSLAEDETVACEDGGSGECASIANDEAYADIRDEIASIEGDVSLVSNATLAELLEAIENASSDLTEAQALVVPQKTPSLQEDMLSYLDDLLDVETTPVDETALIPPPPTRLTRPWKAKSSKARQPYPALNRRASFAGRPFF